MFKFERHALDNISVRGATEEEVLHTLENGRVSDARPPRLAKEMVFTEGYDWKGRFYPHKSVRVIYVWDSDEDAFVIVTVYVFYGRWEV